MRNPLCSDIFPLYCPALNNVGIEMPALTLALSRVRIFFHTYLNLNKALYFAAFERWIPNADKIWYLSFVYTDGLKTNS